MFELEPILVLSDLKLFAIVISRQQKLPLAWKELERLFQVFVAIQAVVLDLGQIRVSKL